MVLTVETNDVLTNLAVLAQDDPVHPSDGLGKGTTLLRFRELGRGEHFQESGLVVPVSARTWEQGHLCKRAISCILTSMQRSVDRPRPSSRYPD